LKKPKNIGKDYGLSIPTFCRNQLMRLRDGLSRCPVVLVGNKVDLEDHRKVTTIEGQELANSWGTDVMFFEASAKSRINIEEQFFALTRAIRDSPPNTKPQQKKKGILSTIKKWLVKS
jgi:GTPase SAR1 family protein